MATEIQTPATSASPRTTPSGIVPYRLTVRQFEKMIEAGIFRDKDRVELLGGILVDKMTKNDPHDFSVDFLGRTLGRIVEPAWIVRQEKSIVLGRFSRPQPDLAIVLGPCTRHRLGAPSPADIAFLTEVSDFSYLKDRGANWVRYAAARIPAYWIVNIPQFQVEVYSGPSGKGRSAGYRDLTVYGRDDEVPVIVEGKDLGRIPVREVVS